jgi:hypothetical protein
MKLSSHLLSIVVFAAAAYAPPALAADNSSGVVSALQKKYLLTQTTPDHEQITKDGTTMSMKCAGVYTAPNGFARTTPDNKVVDGKVQPPNKFVQMMLSKMGAHVLQTGDKVYIIGMDRKNDNNNDVLHFVILTTDALDVNGQDAKKKYEANLTFRFKKGYLDETPPEEVEQAIESVIAPDAGGDSQGGDTAGNNAAPPAQQQAKAAPPPAQQQAPPPQAAPATPPPTITIGESSTQVLQAMGMPQQMIDLGKKKTYVYKNMKIVFVDDKVSDVQ